MDKTDNIDTYNLITDFKSLEDESLTMLGLDLDDEIEKTKKRYKKTRSKNKSG